MLAEVQNKLKTAYKHVCYSDHPHCYIQLALVRDEMCNIRDKKLNEIARLTLQGHVDEILKIKEPLKRGLEDIFHYNNLPCPRLRWRSSGSPTQLIVFVNTAEANLFTLLNRKYSVNNPSRW